MMNCDQVAALLMAEVDGELDALRGHDLRRHVSGCLACQARRGQLLALRRKLKSELPGQPAPAALRARVLVAVQDSPEVGVFAVERWRWFGTGLAAGALAGGVAVAMLWAAVVLPWQPSEVLATQVVAMHNDAKLGHRLVEVESTDRHQIKPWLSAHLDYASPVVEDVAEGFVMVGARVDHLGGHSVAVLVYRRRNHVIDVVARPADPTCAAGALPTVRGFHVAAACGAQMQWLAVSDLNLTELTEFLQTLARAAALAG